MSSMYKFVKGSRLFMQGTRQNTDYDNVSDTFHPTFADNEQFVREKSRSESKFNAWHQKVNKSNVQNKYTIDTKIGKNLEPKCLHFLSVVSATYVRVSMTRNR